MSVWFHLHDSASDQPLTSTSRVTLPPGSTVDQFRYAVKLEYPNKLLGFASSQLVVFKNKASFEQREKPLEVDSIIDGLGTSANEALIVVVPANNELQSLLVDAAKSLKTQPPPSALARGTLSIEFLTNPDCAYLLHRPHSGDPVELMVEEFGVFIDNCSNIKLERDDIAAAVDFRNLMCAFQHKNENGRRAEACQFLGNYFGMYVSPIFTHTSRYRMMDMGLRASNGIVIMHGVVKNELGTDGGCAYLQQAFNYGQFLPENPNIVPNYRCPSFGLVLCGPFFCVTGMAFLGDGKVICDPLTDLIPALCSLNDFPRLLRIARVLASLKQGVLNLKSAAEDLTKRQPNTEFPYLCNFSNAGRLEYVQRVYAEKQIYVCRNYKDNALFVVKFTKSYSIKAHELSASWGMAPALHDFVCVPGGWYALVMDMAQGPRADEITDMHQRQSVASVMEDYLSRLHQAGFVHGDFRPSNIIVSFYQGSPSIKVIDFDGSGEQGKCDYNYFINDVIPWADGVVVGGPIAPQHDSHFVDLYKLGQL